MISVRNDDFTGSYCSRNRHLRLLEATRSTSRLSETNAFEQPVLFWQVHPCKNTSIKQIPAASCCIWVSSKMTMGIRVAKNTEHTRDTKKEHTTTSRARSHRQSPHRFLSSRLTESKHVKRNNIYGSKSLFCFPFF